MSNMKNLYQNLEDAVTALGQAEEILIATSNHLLRQTRFDLTPIISRTATTKRHIQECLDGERPLDDRIIPQPPESGADVFVCASCEDTFIMGNGGYVPRRGWLCAVCGEGEEELYD